MADDRVKVVRLWQRFQRERAVEDTVHLLSSPAQPMTLHFLDLRDAHDIRLAIVLPGRGGSRATRASIAGAGRGARETALLHADRGRGRARDRCDDAFTEMFGYTGEELVGESVLDQIHPDDQGRAVEGWMAVVSSNRAQQTRLRRRRKDGSYMWVDTTLHNFLNDPDRNYVVVEIIDVSAEMAAQEALHEHEELLRRLTDAMPVGLLPDRRRPRGRLHQLLAPARAALGHEPQAGSGPEIGRVHGGRTPLAELLSGLSEKSRQLVVGAFDRVLEDGCDEDLEVDVVPGHGKTRRAMLSIRALRRPDGTIVGAISSTLDITDSARAREELEHRATYDTLTDVHNRSSILAVLQEELAREDSERTGVVYVDLDKFKPVNDTLGHAAGDELLCSSPSAWRGTREGAT